MQTYRLARRFSARCIRPPAPIRISASAPASQARRGSSRQPTVVRTLKGEFTADFLICGTGLYLRLRRNSLQSPIRLQPGGQVRPPPHEREDRLAAIPTSAPTMPSRVVPGTALPQGHPLLRHRCLDEFRHERCLDQCDVRRCAQTRRRCDAWPLRRGTRQPLERSSGIRPAKSHCAKRDRYSGTSRPSNSAVV